MSFDDLPPQPSINATADAYALECLKRSREAAARTRCELDLPYGSDYWQKVDVYLPPGNGHRDLPVFMFLHGGGWCWGYKEWCGFMAPALLDLPAIFVSVSYRLLPDVSYPQPVEDAIAAVKWVQDHIATYGGAPGHILVGGHSAGGHIAALAALRPEWIAAAGAPPDAIKGVFCLSATFNRRMVDETRAPGHNPPGDPAAIAPDSPIALAANARMPFHIAWGGREHERLERSGRQMIAALQRAGCAVEHQVFPDDDHFSIHLKTGDAGDPWTLAVRRALARQPAKAA
jgi:arylformamidase